MKFLLSQNFKYKLLLLLLLLLPYSTVRGLRLGLQNYDFRGSPYHDLDSDFESPYPDDTPPEELNYDNDDASSPEPCSTGCNYPPPTSPPPPLPPFGDCDRDRDKDCGSDVCGGNDDEGGKQNPRLKATSIAQNAAQVAKAANEAQASAAHEASRQVKMQLAEKALAAAHAADAVVEGKQEIVDNYARELREAEAVVSQVCQSLECSESSAEVAFAAAKEAESEMATFKNILEQGKISLSDIEGLLEQANADLEEKTQMLTAVKGRGDRLGQQVACARSEYEQVKEAAFRAANAAVEARQKASVSLCRPEDGGGGLGGPSCGGGGGGALPTYGVGMPTYGGAARGAKIQAPVNPSGASSEALLDLYRQRRRQQLRQRRQQKMLMARKARIRDNLMDDSSLNYNSF